MKKFLKSKKTWVAAAMALVLAMGGATYAWFTHYDIAEFGEVTMGKIEVAVTDVGLAYIDEDPTALNPNSNPVNNWKFDPTGYIYGDTITPDANGYEHLPIRFKVKPGTELQIGYTIENLGDAAIVQLPWVTDALMLSKVNGLDKTNPVAPPAGFPWNAQPLAAATPAYTFAQWEDFEANPGTYPVPAEIIGTNSTIKLGDIDPISGDDISKLNDQIWPEDGIVLAPAKVDSSVVPVEDEEGFPLSFIQYYSAHEGRYLDIMNELTPASIYTPDHYSLDTDLNAEVYRDTADGRFYAKMLTGDKITVVYDLTFDKYLNNSFQNAELTCDPDSLYAKAVQLTPGEFGEPEAFADFFDFEYRQAVNAYLVGNVLTDAAVDSNGDEHGLLWFADVDYLTFFGPF